MSVAATHRVINAVWRIESAKIIAGLARIVRDVGLAEDLAQDALVAALEQWPEQGVPDNPAAWLTAVAKHRAIDRLRQSKLKERKNEEIIRELNSRGDSTTPDFVAALDDDIGDDLLRLIFTACHPALSAEARAQLTLRLLGGLTTGEIARAFLVPEPKSPSESSGQSGPWLKLAFPSKSLAPPSSASACPLFSKSSI